MTNRVSHNTKQSLITCIKEKFSEIKAAQIQNACSRFLIRIEWGLAADSGYIE
uniref:Uncharacterized protein n=1 Tax=Lepeophtheirus salmonis TaxID=72036 RepID=A0A0K2V0Z4_LEPSM